MGVADSLLQVFEDAYFAVVNAIDATKKLVFDLSGSTTGKTVTLKTEATVDRTLTLPDKDGTLETVEAERTALVTNIVDYAKSDILTLNMSASITLTLNNPVQGKTLLIEAEPNGFNLSFPPSVRIISGRFKSNTTNYVYFHCIDGTTPIYVVTIGQQVA